MADHVIRVRGPLQEADLGCKERAIKLDYNCQGRRDTYKIFFFVLVLKFADDTSVIGLIRDNKNLQTHRRLNN